MKFLYEQINFDDKMVCYYDELSLWSSPFGILLLNNIPLIKNSIVVDIGCGTGFPLLEVAQRFGETSKVFGIDPWEKAVKRANEKKKQYGIKNVEIINGTGDDMPFDDDHIDIIISNLGINNFENPDSVIAECFRVLKPGGKLIFTTNLSGHFDEFYSIFRVVLNDLKLNDEINNLDKHIKKRHSIEDINELVNRNRLSIKRIVQEKYTMRFVDGSTFFNHYFVRLAFLEGWKKIIKEENLDKVFMIMEKRLDNVANINGEIKLNVPIAYIECEK